MIKASVNQLTPCTGIDSLKSNELKEFGATMTNLKNKMPSLKKIILSSLENELNNVGYTYDKEYSGGGEYAFLRDNFGFKVGLSIDKSSWGNIIRPFLVTPITSSGNMHYLTEGVGKEYPFENENDIRNDLQKILEHFLTKGIYWIEHNELVGFNPLDAYNEIIDKELKFFSFNRISTDENILCGGMVVYGNGRQEIKFKHNNLFANIRCYYNNKGTEIDIGTKILEEYVEKDPSKLILPYKDKDTYIDCLNKFINFLKVNYI